MRPSRRAQAVAGDQAAWSARSARLFGELRGPATGMVRRAYGRAFDEHAIEDVYAAAWLGTYRALAGRHHDLDDDEIRSYVLTRLPARPARSCDAAAGEPTRRWRALAGSVTSGRSPEERAAARAIAVTRDLFASLPRTPSRRADAPLRLGP